MKPKESAANPVNEKMSKATNTAFIILFPAFLLAIIAVFYAPLYVSILAIGIAGYQFLMLKKFIEDYYRK